MAGAMLRRFHGLSRPLVVLADLAASNTLGLASLNHSYLPNSRLTRIIRSINIARRSQVIAHYVAASQPISTVTSIIRQVV
ncbi:hypothetical protein SE18_00975 [Herpetosiphon geysericola]|uniref:Uncharacterized protein n=1 Tax=Herpetosiphon geysericola TaxID=70996 RepID=A0A0P6Z3Z7_9CHLR|nr:hypothetical protein SE18_00975 [Herpetosiphon geysericola]